jgi:predicted Zn-dependent protease
MVRCVAEPAWAPLRESLYASAFTALGLRNTGDAQRYFALMLAVAPFDPRAWMGLAATREQLADHRAAANFYAVAAELDPKSVYCRLGQARALVALHQRDLAEQVLLDVERLTDDPDTRSAIAQLRSDL